MPLLKMPDRSPSQWMRLQDIASITDNGDGTMSVAQVGDRTVTVVLDPKVMAAFARYAASAGLS